MPRRRKTALHKPLWRTKTYWGTAASVLVTLGGLTVLKPQHREIAVALGTVLSAVAATTARHGAGEAAREAAGEEEPRRTGGSRQQAEGLPEDTDVL